MFTKEQYCPGKRKHDKYHWRYITLVKTCDRSNIDHSTLTRLFPKKKKIMFSRTKELKKKKEEETPNKWKNHSPCVESKTVSLRKSSVNSYNSSFRGCLFVFFPISKHPRSLHHDPSWAARWRMTRESMSVFRNYSGNRLPIVARSREGVSPEDADGSYL